MFECDRCGACCRNLNKSEIYKDLDRGDGCCKYYNDESKLCNIYEDRPLKCRIDDSYYAFYSKDMDIESYYALNKRACNMLRDTRTE